MLLVSVSNIVRPSCSSSSLPQYHLKSVIHTLIAHRTSWQLRQGQFQHSFGRGLASRALPSPATAGSIAERQVGMYPMDAAEAEAAMVAAHGTLGGKMEALTVFDLRDALRVCMCVYYKMEGLQMYFNQTMVISVAALLSA